MNAIVRIDHFFIRLTEYVLDWLLEWLSITQSVIEKVMIGGYAVAAGMVTTACARKVILIPPSVVAVAAFIVLAVMVNMHLGSGVARKALLHFSVPKIWRLYGVCVTGIDCLPPYKHVLFCDFGLPLSIFCFAFFSYVIVSNCTRERGRKRKMAWAKLKELFSWLPEPVPGGA